MLSRRYQAPSLMRELAKMTYGTLDNKNGLDPDGDPVFLDARLSMCVQPLPTVTGDAWLEALLIFLIFVGGLLMTRALLTELFLRSFDARYSATGVNSQLDCLFTQAKHGRPEASSAYCRQRRMMRHTSIAFRLPLHTFQARQRRFITFLLWLGRGFLTIGDIGWSAALCMYSGRECCGAIAVARCLALHSIG